MPKSKPLPAKSKAAIGAHVQYCGHDGWFVADVFHFEGVVGVKANGPVTPGNIVRNRMDEATHQISDFPKAGLWCPDRGVFCVPEDQFHILK